MDLSAASFEMLLKLTETCSGVQLNNSFIYFSNSAHSCFCLVAHCSCEESVLVTVGHSLSQ